MALNGVTSTLSLSHHQQEVNGTAKNDNLKGIMPRDQLREHLAFHLNNFFQGKDVRSQQDIYAVSCRTAAETTQQTIILHQLTSSGCGGG